MKRERESSLVSDGSYYKDQLIPLKPGPQIVVAYFEFIFILPLEVCVNQRHLPYRAKAEI
jgi:hypothetical protein